MQNTPKGEVSLWMVRQDEVDKVWDTVLKVIAEAQNQYPLKLMTELKQIGFLGSQKMKTSVGAGTK